MINVSGKVDENKILVCSFSSTVYNDARFTTNIPLKVWIMTLIKVNFGKYCCEKICRLFRTSNQIAKYLEIIGDSSKKINGNKGINIRNRKKLELCVLE